ncbi:MAG: hypothetical protein N4A45_06775 [Flavobacteriales bacterium]|jgi:hypothetical protein|nr:hypothetical protein [Flavobacteriales bacterium]
MKAIKYIGLSLSISLLSLNYNCGGNPESQKQVTEARAPQKINQTVNGLKEGLHVAKNDAGQFRRKINFKAGKRHGKSYDYYDDGKLRAVIDYQEGQKHGEAIWYFDGKKVFRINRYQNNLKHGAQEKFYKNGQELSVLEFYEDQPGVGLKEWTENGTPLLSTTNIVLKKQGNKLVATLDSGNEKADFYYGNLTEGKFLNNKLLDITATEGEGIIKKSRLKDLNEITITAKYSTYLKNSRIITKTVKWSEI